MKCLSVRQPWARLIEVGAKTIELRSRPTRFRGPIIVCACIHAPRAPAVSPWDLGVTVAVVEIVDCRPAENDDARAAQLAPPAGSWAWVLRGATSLPRIPHRGQLSIHDLPEGEERRLRAALSEWLRAQ